MKDFILPTRLANGDIDMGTPASKSDVMVTLQIDGFDVTVPEGTSVMRASAEARVVCALSKSKGGGEHLHPARRP